MKTQAKLKKFYIKTYGCQMNFSESEIISGILLEYDFESVETPEEADIIILNTCAIRDTATNKVIGKLGQLKRLKEFQDRNADKSKTALKRLQKVALTGGNIFEEMMETVNV